MSKKLYQLSYQDYHTNIRLDVINKLHEVLVDVIKIAFSLLILIFLCHIMITLKRIHIFESPSEKKDNDLVFGQNA